MSNQNIDSIMVCLSPSPSNIHVIRVASSMLKNKKDHFYALYISDKILHLRIFEDENNKMNLSLLDTKGALMIVSQFTLYGDSRHGRRPSFTEAELPKQASRLYEHVVRSCRIEGIKVETGNFQTHMQVALENDGPVTLLLDSEKLF